MITDHGSRDVVLDKVLTVQREKVIARDCKLSANIEVGVNTRFSKNRLLPKTANEPAPPGDDSVMKFVLRSVPLMLYCPTALVTVVEAKIALDDKAVTAISFPSPTFIK